MDHIVGFIPAESSVPTCMPSCIEQGWAHDHLGNVWPHGWCKKLLLNIDDCYAYDIIVAHHSTIFWPPILIAVRLTQEFDDRTLVPTFEHLSSKVARTVNY